MADMVRVQTKSPRFEPSNPLTILRCTFDFVKSNRAITPADAHPKARYNGALLVLTGRLKPATLTPRANRIRIALEPTLAQQPHSPP